MIPNIKNDLDILVQSNFGLAVALKKWYTGGYNVILVRTGGRLYFMKGYKGAIIIDDGRDEVLKRFEYMGRWTHKMVSHEIKKLKLNYPMKVTRKYNK